MRNGLPRPSRKKPFFRLLQRSGVKISLRMNRRLICAFFCVKMRSVCCMSYREVNSGAYVGQICGGLARGAFYTVVLSPLVYAAKSVPIYQNDISDLSPYITTIWYRW